MMLLTYLLSTGVAMFIPAVVLAETVRGAGPRDAPVNRVFAAARAILEIDGSTGRLAGMLLGKARSDATIDALVVASALQAGGGRILTTDPDDLEKLAADRREIRIHPI